MCLPIALIVFPSRKKHLVMYKHTGVREATFPPILRLSPSPSPSPPVPAPLAGGCELIYYDLKKSRAYMGHPRGSSGQGSHWQVEPAWQAPNIFFT